MNWPPFYGESLKGKGVFSNIVISAFTNAKYSISISFVPWARALRDVETGRMDGLLGAYKTDERVATMYYSNPVYFAEEVFFQLSKKNEIEYKTLADLKPYRIGTITGVSNSVEFDEATYLNKETSSNLDSLIKKLLNGRVDLIVQGKLVVIDHMNKQYPTRKNEILQLHPPLVKRPLYVTIKKDRVNSLKIIKDFNHSLNNLVKSGKLRQILKEYNFNGME